MGDLRIATSERDALAVKVIAAHHAALAGAVDKVQGQVMGKTDGSPTSPALTEEVANNTGSGVAVNTLDPNLLGGAPADKWTSDPTANGYFNALRFVRAIGG